MRQLVQPRHVAERAPVLVPRRKVVADDAGEDEGGKACACTSSASPGAGLLLLVGGLGLTRRRRRQLRG